MADQEFFDADDFFEPKMLEKMYRRALDKNTDITICYDNKTKNLSAMPWSLRRDLLPDKDPFSYMDMPDHIFNAFQNWPWNKLFRHSFVIKNKLRFQNVSRATDLFFTCLALVTAERITTIEEELVSYRTGHDHSINSTNTNAPSDLFLAFYALKQALVERGIFERLEQSYVNWALSGCIHNLMSIKPDTSRRNLYDNLRRNYFHRLGIDQHPEDYFYDQVDYSTYKTKKFPVISDINSKSLLLGGFGNLSRCLNVALTLGRIPQQDRSRQV